MKTKISFTFKLQTLLLQELFNISIIVRFKVYFSLCVSACFDMWECWEQLQYSTLFKQQLGDEQWLHFDKLSNKHGTLSQRWITVRSGSTNTCPKLFEWIVFVEPRLHMYFLRLNHRLQLRPNFKYTLMLNI